MEKKEFAGIDANKKKNLEYKKSKQLFFFISEM
jgi:hypothetical protein